MKDKEVQNTVTSRHENKETGEGPLIHRSKCKGNIKSKQ